MKIYSVIDRTFMSKKYKEYKKPLLKGEDIKYLKNSRLIS